ncbi:putative bifunctional diguanylate cyclase/phosphodiesterase [Sorangium cellulosum]|uniref:putative bifunctional diguanylate cyclase/phosphodiesterase n=1 Tax=Sorangium cellulosum TaxID=56 RepID=UPI001F5D4FE2|nr:EAL domain-containing protein [Sorangium cellulosum]
MAKIGDRPESSLHATFDRSDVHRGSPDKQLAAWLSEVDVGVIELDAEQRVVRVNGAAERLTGWSIVEARGALVDRVLRLIPAAGTTGGDQDVDDGEMNALFDEGAPAKAAPALVPRREPAAPLAPVIIDEGALRAVDEGAQGTPRAPAIVDEGALRAVDEGALRAVDEGALRAVDEGALRAPGPPLAPQDAGGTGRPKARYTALLERRDGSVIPILHTIGAITGRPSREGQRDTKAPPPPGQLILFRELGAPGPVPIYPAKPRYDALTSLLDRYAIIDRIEDALSDCRKTGTPYALCYIDLDRFRLVNATCGHEAGDDLLQWVATRVHEIVGPKDAAGRIGGDEFVLLLAGKTEREAERIARDLQICLLEFRFGWAEKTFSIGASIGLVVLGPHFERAVDVLGAADHACRVAKENGRGRLQVYLEDQQMTTSRRSMQWVASLQRHLAEGRLRLYAQGIHALTKPGAPRGPRGAHFEVLVRQLGDDGRFYSPVGIIQAAEQSGLIHVIDRYVARQAFRLIGALPQHALRRLDTCSINLSGVSLLREGLLDFLVEQLHRAQVPPSKICFEITETAALANLGEVLWFMQELGAMGCRFAIDDFGSGHASYGYLESLPVDYVKIDGMFVRDLKDNTLHRAIVESVHRIGDTLGIKTVAEQVENQEIADLLTSMGIHYAQGWHFDKPQPLVDLCASLRAEGDPPDPDPAGPPAGG